MKYRSNFVTNGFGDLDSMGRQGFYGFSQRRLTVFPQLMILGSNRPQVANNV